jgi:hypothetical protein
MAIAKELLQYKLDLMGVQEVRCDRGGSEPAGEYTLSYGKGNERPIGLLDVEASKFSRQSDYR